MCEFHILVKNFIFAYDDLLFSITKTKIFLKWRTARVAALRERHIPDTGTIHLISVIWFNGIRALRQ
jgi:hypothetical protein